MGLDVYLYTKAQQDSNALHDQMWDDWFALWGEQPDSDEKTLSRTTVPDYQSCTDVPSERFPGHLFNRRYLRSSYNNSGFESAVPDMVGKDHGLYWIFEPVRLADQYEIELTEASIPALEMAKGRALKVAEEIRNCDPLRTTDASGLIGPAEHLWQQLPTGDEVLAWYRSEKARNAGREDLTSYSNARGNVYGFNSGLDVLAATVGRDVIGRPYAVLVFRLDKEALDSYTQSAEITAEFCDEAISLIRTDGSCSMHWSG